MASYTETQKTQNIGKILLPPPLDTTRLLLKVGERKIPLDLKTLKIGIENPNLGYFLAETISFLENVNTGKLPIKIFTAQKENEMRQMHPIHSPDYAIYILGNAEKPKPKSKAGETRLVTQSENFMAILEMQPLSLEVFNIRRITNIYLFTELSRQELIKNTPPTDMLQNNWTFPKTL